jgi:hypothetical protein
VSRPRVVIDLEKLRRINCGLGRFSLHLAEGILAGYRARIEPVFLVPERQRSRFAAEGLQRELELGGKAIHVIPLGLAAASHGARA